MSPSLKTRFGVGNMNICEKVYLSDDFGKLAVVFVVAGKLRVA